MDSDGFDYNALRSLNPSFSLSATARKTQASKIFSMTQSRNQSENNPQTAFKFAPHRDKKPDNVIGEPKRVFAFPKSQQPVLTPARPFASLTVAPKLSVVKAKEEPSGESDEESHFSPPPTFRSSSPHAPNRIMLPPTLQHEMVHSTPGPRARYSSSSRALNDIETGGDRDAGSNLHDIAMKALGEHRTVTAELAEERRHTQSLRAKLSSLKSVNDSVTAASQQLQSELNVATTSFNTLTSEHAATLDTLASTQSALAATQSERSSLATERESLQAEIAVLAKAKEDVVEHGRASIMKSEEAAAEMATSRQRERVEAESKMRLAKKGLVDLSHQYQTLQGLFSALRDTHEAAVQMHKLEMESMREALVELRAVRGWVGESVRALEPLLDDSASCLGKGAEMRALIRELQNELAGSHRVTDLLRDKLHHLSAQLVEARGRVTELEAEKQETWGQWAKHHRLEKMVEKEGESAFKIVGARVEELVVQLAKREKETIDVLAEAVSLEERLGVANERLDGQKVTLAKQDAELMALRSVREEKQLLEIELGKANEKIRVPEALVQDKRKAEELEVSRKALQEALEDAKGLYANVKVMGKTLDERQILIDQLETRLSTVQTIVETLEETNSETNAKEVAAMNRIDELQGDLVKMAEQGASKETASRAANTRITVLEERLEAQGVTLRLAKECSGDLQERLLTSEKSHALEIVDLRTEIGILQEQKSGLEKTLAALQRESESQRAAFVGASVEFETKLAKQESAHDRLVQAVEKRADMAEKQADEARQAVEELRVRVEEAEGEVEAVRKAAMKEKELEKQKLEQAVEGHVRGLRAQIGELQALNCKLLERAASLKSRYKEGDLCDDEKDFVDSLMQISHSIHEQDIVAKSNELRRRDNMISTLQARIVTLESTLARLLQEKGKGEGPQPASMIDLKMWMTSSPEGAGPDGPRAAQVPSPSASTTTPTSVAPAPLVSATIIQTTNKKKATKLSQRLADTGPTVAAASPPPVTFAKINASLDSDDDTPLSQLSELSVLGKRERVSSPPLPVEKPHRVVRRSVAFPFLFVSSSRCGLMRGSKRCSGLLLPLVN